MTIPRMKLPEQIVTLPRVLFTDEGIATLRRVSSEQWAVYMRASGSKVLERLGARLVVTGAVMHLEPWRFLERSGPQDRKPGESKKEAAIAAYERKRRREEKLRELADRFEQIGE